MPRPKSSGLSREEDEKAKVDSLLDVAAEVFLEVGYQVASTGEIARRAHASKQTFYARFPSKEKLFLAVIIRKMSQTTEAIDSLLDEKLNLRDILLSLARHFHEVVIGAENIALLRIVYMEAQRFPEIGEAFLQSGPELGTQRLAKYLDRQMKLGKIKKADADLAAEQFVGLIHGQELQRALVGISKPQSKKKIELRIAKCVELFLAGYSV